MAIDDTGTRLQNGLLETLQAAQTGLRQALHAVDLAPATHGQPGWPFAHRIATETLVIDAGLARQVAEAIAGGAMALLLVAIGMAWRRGRWPAWILAAALCLALPWPAASLVFTDAVATSFHRSPTGFDAASVERGLATYQSRCAACHGSDGGGEGPRAASLSTWPPHLDGDLLWRRAEGEVFWRIVHGMRDRHGSETMPGFAGQLSDAEVWSLIDGMKAIAAAQGMRSEAAWTQPVRAPDAAVHCDDGHADRPLSSFVGQRLRIVAGGPGARMPVEDPRFVTIALRPAAQAHAAGCAIASPQAWAAFAQVSGASPATFAGAQVLVDRDGWLRAYGAPGKSAWSREDVLCRSADGPAPQKSASGRDGLGDVVQAIDDDPIRLSALGFAHTP